MSLIEKIDKRIEYYRGFHSDRFHAKADGLEQAREIILSEQKEPCEYCQEDRYDELVFASNHENIETYCGVWIDHDKLHQKLVVEDYETIEEEIKINFCPMCGRPLNQPYTE